MSELTVWQEESVAFLKNPDGWPNWPVCPVVRRGAGWPEVRLVVETLANQPIRVYKKGMFDLVTGPIDEQLFGVEFIEYPDVLSMVKDGWEVD